ncbi:MAG TPA: hypothetical protein VNT30_08160 [Stellaceae bacterium]|nr:hypothetical protein [Stellaceae bacterium]
MTEHTYEKTGDYIGYLLRTHQTETVFQLVASKLPKDFSETVTAILADVDGVPLFIEAYRAIGDALINLSPAPDSFDALAVVLSRLGVPVAANTAYKMAAELDFKMHPNMDASIGPFNGQMLRRTIFNELVNGLGISTVVETGTFRATSTTFMAEANLRIFACEKHPRYCKYAKLRLAPFKNVEIFCGEHSIFLSALFERNVLSDKPTLFYLASNSQEDLPVWAEINLILRGHPNAVIMIDDFRVPGDPGYSYDDQGPEKALSALNLRRNLGDDMAIFFPRQPSAGETGARRGCVVLAPPTLAHTIEKAVPSLATSTLHDALLLDSFAPMHDMAGSMSFLQAEFQALRTQVTTLDVMMQQYADLSAALHAAELSGRQHELAAKMQMEATTAAKEEAARLHPLITKLVDELSAVKARETELSARNQNLSEKLEACQAREQELVFEMTNSRWRALGKRLGLARKASFER